MPDPQFPPEQPVRGSVAEAVVVYRLLFNRSVAASAFVFGVVALLEVLEHARPNPLVSVVVSLSGLAGPIVVQGALVQIVRNVHEGRRPEGMSELFAHGGRRFWPLLLASFLYALGVACGLILLVVPGLLALTRWSLMAPAIVLEGRGVLAARRRSKELVQGHGPQVFRALFVVGLVVAVPAAVIAFAPISFAMRTILSFLWSALTAPLTAHLYTVIYYRLAEPGRPVIAPVVRQWRSVWDGR